MKFDRFPTIVADDLFARSLFAKSERCVVDSPPFIVEAPFDVKSLIRQRTRIYFGNLEFNAQASLADLPGAKELTAPWWQPVANQPALLLRALPYLAINSIAKLRARKIFNSNREVPWSKDNSTRIIR